MVNPSKAHRCYCQRESKKCSCPPPEREQSFKDFSTTTCLGEPECKEACLNFYPVIDDINITELVGQPLISLKTCDSVWHFPNEPKYDFTFWFIIKGCKLFIVIPDDSLCNFKGSEVRISLLYRDKKC